MNQFAQELRYGQRLSAFVRFPGAVLRRVLFFTAVAALTTLGVSLMYRVLQGNGMQPLEIAVFVLFSATFLWIAIAFCSAMVGVVLTLWRLDPLTLRRHAPRHEVEAGRLLTRSAAVMPVHNEEVDRVIAGLEATIRDLERTGEGEAFDFFLLSDSSDDAIAGRERQAVAALQQRMACARARTRLFYRRRTSNEGRKAGNIAEFCESWSGYDHMVVLDADSIMAGETLVRLARAMQANPSAGIIQTVPLPARQKTPFGRALQFAATLYSPLLANGQSFWQMDAANYWGHNAIIRMAPFKAHCGLPVLPGSPPLGGEILSHDFVEAALMRRAGWDVLLMPDLGGSYEEVPGNVLDYAQRDRRWSEGNLQHVRLLGMPGLHGLNRLHFVLGAFAYGCSLLWLLMLAVSSADAIMRAVTRADYFGATPALFPNWPVTRVGEMWSLLAIVVVMLLLPKLLGVVVCLRDPERRRAFGGVGCLLVSATVEMVMSVLVAPILMCFHARFVIAILMGQRVRWEPPRRDGRHIGWPDALRCTVTVSLVGVVWGLVIHAITPIFFWALTPVLIGLVFSAPLVALSGHPGLGRYLQRWGVFTTPAETVPDQVLTDTGTLYGR